MTMVANLCIHLVELVICCDEDGRVSYANPAARRWSHELLEGKSFISLLTPDSAQKGLHFLDAARAATLETPTPPWELTLGATDDYTICSFRGYADDGQLVLVGLLEPAQVLAMQRELLALTSDLTEAQREQRRQNRALQQALADQRRLIETIHELSAPAVPIARGVLLLPLFGHMDSRRMQVVAEQLLERVSATRARYVILDLSGIAAVDTTVAQHLIMTAQALKLLGVQPVLVGINPEIAQTVVHLGIDLTGFTVRSDLQRAVAYVLRTADHSPRPR